MSQNLQTSTPDSQRAGWLGHLQLRQRWDGLGHREQRLVLIATSLVTAALLWWIALAPALATLQLAQEQHLRLDAQMQQMQTLKAQAGALVAQPKVLPDDARRSLEASLKQTLGASAQMGVAGNRATVTLKGASPDSLAQWLTQARINARASTAEVRLVKAVAPSPGALAPTQIRWDGTVVLTLPER